MFKLSGAGLGILFGSVRGRGERQDVGHHSSVQISRSSLVRALPWRLAGAGGGGGNLPRWVALDRSCSTASGKGTRTRIQSGRAIGSPAERRHKSAAESALAASNRPDA